MNNNDIKKFVKNNIKDPSTINFLKEIKDNYGNNGLISTLTGNTRPIVHPNVEEQYKKHYTAITWNLNIPTNYSGGISYIPPKAYDFGMGYQVKLFPDLDQTLFKENSTLSILIISINDYSEVFEQGTINLNITPKALLVLDTIDYYKGQAAEKIKIDGKEEKIMAFNQYKLIDEERFYWMNYYTFCGPMKAIVENNQEDRFKYPFIKQYTKQEKKTVTMCIVLQKLDNDNIEVTMALVKPNELTGKDILVQTTKTYSMERKVWDINTLTIGLEWVNSREGVPFINVEEPNNEIYYNVRSPTMDDDWIHEILGPFFETIKVYNFRN